MQSKKQRGRPKGTGVPTDPKILNAVADLILHEPTLRPTTAIKRVVTDWTDSIVHRLLGKWREQKKALLADARRRDAEVRQVRCNVTPSSPALLADVWRIYDDPAVRAARDFASSPAVKMAREMIESAQMREVSRITNSPAMRMVREMQNNPVVKMMKEQDLIRRSLGL